MRILAIVQGRYGQRIATNVERQRPDGWVVTTWTAPPVLPPVIDYPEEFLPEELPSADLILSLGEHPGVAELLPEIVALSAAQAVIAPIDNQAWLPPGLMRQVARWLAAQGVTVVFPKPFCSLTETSYDTGRRQSVPYRDRHISAFARRFGRPHFQVTYDGDQEGIGAIQVLRDTPCGCASYVAERIAGIGADEAEQEAGLLHHHYPCLASMGIDPDYSDTLMHVSGNILKAEISEGIAVHKQPPPYLRPSGLSD